MVQDAPAGRARQMWVELAGAPVSFPTGGIEVVTSAASRLCPPGWAGIVVIGNAGIATVPTSRPSRLSRRSRLSRPSRPSRLRAARPVRPKAA